MVRFRTRPSQLLGVAFLLVAIALLGLGRWWTRNVIPPLDGRIGVSGLQASIDVRFDRFAIPHICRATRLWHLLAVPPAGARLLDGMSMTGALRRDPNRL